MPPGPRNNPHIPDSSKQLLVSMHEMGMTPKELIARTPYSSSTVYDVLSTHRLTGKVHHRLRGSGRLRKMRPLDILFLEGFLKRTPDAYDTEILRALREGCELDISISSVKRTLKARGWTRKKLARPARERNEEQRFLFKIAMLSYSADQLVFADESAYNRLTLRRAYGWSQEGNRAPRREFFIKGKRYSILPALSLDGILETLVHEGSITSEIFNEFVQRLLNKMNPYPGPNSVLVVDNARIHKSDELLEMIEERGMRIEFLPPYSPDFNPIEEGFASMKAWLRRNRDFVEAEMETGREIDAHVVLWDAVHSITPDMARGWYTHSGYL